MLKSELIACATIVIGNKAQAAATLNALFAIMTEELKQNGVFTIPNLGSFKLIQHKARKGRNPQTGEQIEIPARKAIKFTPIAALKQEITDYTL